LLRSPDVDLDSNEALSQGFYSIDGPGPAILDPRDNLPESLEELYLDGVYEDEEWEQLVELFKTLNASTPKLMLEKICVRRLSARWDINGALAKFGGAAEPPHTFKHPLTTRLLTGHGY
jgi:hypothetical protein